MSPYPSDPNSNDKRARAPVRAEAQSAQLLTAYYRAQAEARPPAPQAFSTQWDKARQRAERPPLLSRLQGRSIALGAIGLSTTATALWLALAPTVQAPTQGRDWSAQAGERSQPHLVEDERAQDAFAWGDGWLEGEEWSLEWSAPEERTPPPTHPRFTKDREG